MNSFIILIVIVIVVLIILIRNINGYKITSYLNKFLNNFEQRDIYDTSKFEWTKQFRNKYKDIYKELLRYNKDIPRYSEIDDAQYILDHDKSKWKTLFLRLYGKDTDIKNQFPITTKLLNNINCTTAMFSIIEPGKIIKPHYGVYSGVLRYHLGLKVPKNHKDCFIVVNGFKNSWKNGKDLLFDDTYLHYVENNTDEERVILFLDIVKEYKNPIINYINKSLMYILRNNKTVVEVVNNVNLFAN